MLALVGGKLIDGTGVEPLDDSVLLIDEKVIAGVGRAGHLPIPPGAQVLDASGKTVMPGLIDAHVHMLAEGYGLERMLAAPFSYAFFKAAEHLRATLEAGVTTVRDAGGADLGVKLAVEHGLVAGPRLVISVGALSQTGGHGDSYLPSGFELDQPYPGAPRLVCDGADEARKATRLAIRAGADVIKIMASGGVLSVVDDLDASQFSAGELAVIVGEAHAAHRRVMAHATSKAGILNALRAGVESIEHGVFADDECIDELLARGAYLVPTLSAAILVKEAAEQRGQPLPDHVRRKGERYIESHLRSVARAAEAGVKIALGTDAGVAGHGHNARELALLAEAGLSPMQAIVAATQTAAECLALEDRVGTLQPGKLADILVVDGDPLADIRVLQNKDRIETVIKDGQMVKSRWDRGPSAIVPGLCGGSRGDCDEDSTGGRRK
jgi:imidazolonepropionase-like amidohydrolase